MEELDVLCDKNDLTKEELLRVVGLLDQLYKLIDKDGLYVQRTAALARSTTKEDPLECRFVAKSLMVGLKDNPLAISAIRVIIKDLNRMLECTDE